VTTGRSQWTSWRLPWDLRASPTRPSRASCVCCECTACLHAACLLLLDDRSLLALSSAHDWRAAHHWRADKICLALLAALSIHTVAEYHELCSCFECTACLRARCLLLLDDRSLLALSSAHARMESSPSLESEPTGLPNRIGWLLSWLGDKNKNRSKKWQQQYKKIIRTPQQQQATNNNGTIQQE
jgi:hypothetical protein